MKKFYFLILFALIASAATFADAAEKTVTYTFTSKSWEATNDSGETANWTSGKDGTSHESGSTGRGLAVYQSTANATSTESFNKISKIVVICSSNQAKNGSITISIINSKTEELNETKELTNKENNQTFTYSPSTSLSGKVKIAVNTTAKTIWVKSVAITYTDESQSAEPTFSLAEGTYTTEQTIALTSETEGAKIYYKINDASDYTIYSEPIELNEEGTYNITAYTDATDSTIKSEEVTKTYVIDHSYVEPYKLCTNVKLITKGAKIIFVAKNSSNYYGMSKLQKDNNRGTASVTITNNTLTPGSDVAVFTVGESNGNYTFYTDDSYDSDNATVTGYLYAASSDKNYLKTQDTIDSNAEWTISLTSAGAATIKAQGTYNRNTLQFNYNNSSAIFSCYSSGQTTPYIYLLESTSSVSKVAANEGVKVFGAEGGVVVSTDKATDVMVYTIAGQLVSKTIVAAGTSTVSLAPGFYVVRAAGTAAKVVVK